MQTRRRTVYHEGTKRHEDAKIMYPGHFVTLRVLRVFVMIRGTYAESAARLDLLRFNSCVVVLERADAQALLAQRTDRLHRRRRAGERGDARDLVHHRRAAHRAIVEERFA